MLAELGTPEFTILTEIEAGCPRKTVAQSYRLAMESHGDKMDWERVNRAIIERWSLSGLEHVKKLAWSGKAFAPDVRKSGGMAISFTWTLGAVLAGEKTVTRRDWKRSHADKFREGDRVFALDKGYRNGGKRCAVIELTGNPTHEPTSKMPDSDYEAEGFRWLYANRHTVLGYGRDASLEAFERWRSAQEWLWVIRFRLIEVLKKKVEAC